MSIKRLFIALALFVAAVGAALYLTAPAKQDGGAARDGYAVYENETYGLKAEYPAAWRTLEDVPGVAVVFHSPPESAEDKYNDNVNIIVEDVSGKPGTTAEAYVERGVAGLRASLDDFRLLGNKPGAVSGRPARLLEYTGRRGEFRLHFLQAVTVVGGNAYLVTYVAEEDKYAQFLPLAKRIFASVAIK
ncbi:DcrB-related protein [Anaeroselena agilis]|uniref:DcrB-related protein n=1 Tax=Anaeroselena agilis TaxID=3063788 RepID=A0ABU3P4S0_9FIRM|nr:DcrB-related protein [Selenomonadales bacterium 4137-cl]